LSALTAAERALREAFPSGDSVDLGVSDSAIDDVIDERGLPSQQRRIRAEVITALMLRPVAVTSSQLVATRLRGVLMVGRYRPLGLVPLENIILL
jgi:hypothetical protein